MGRIWYKRYYTDFVEHCFRMTVRYNRVEGENAKKWYNFTKQWLATLPDEDSDLIRFVFKKEFYSPIDGMYCYLRKDMTIDSFNDRDRQMYKFDLERMRMKLSEIEREFAISVGLYGLDENQKVNQ